MCAVRVEMACGPGARQPPSSAWVMLRGVYLDQFPRRGLEFRDMTDWNSAAAAVYRRAACGRGLCIATGVASHWALHCYGLRVATWALKLWAPTLAWFATGYELHVLSITWALNSLASSHYGLSIAWAVKCLRLVDW